MPLQRTDETSLLQVVPPSPPTDPNEIAYEAFDKTKRLARAFERGQLTDQAGRTAYEFRRTNDPQYMERHKQLQQRIGELGGDGPGFTGWLGSSSEVAGQMAETFRDVRVPAATAVGAGTFGAIGAAGGPIGSGFGAGIGAGVGAASALAMHSFEVEAGSAYVEYLEQGYDPQVAYWMSAVVGTTNAALEMAGVAAVAAPFKGLFKKEIAQQSSRIVAGVGAYAGAVAGEVTTEVLQELSTIAGSEASRLLSPDQLPGLTQEQIFERLAEVGTKTFKAMTVLATPGAGAAMITANKQARTAQANLEKMDEIAEQAKLLPPETAKEQVEAAVASSGVDQVYIEADRLVEVANASGDPGSFYAGLGLDGAQVSQLEEGATLGGDIRISTKQLTETMLNDSYVDLKDHVRFEEDGVSAAEGKEIEGETKKALEGADEPEATLYHGSPIAFGELRPADAGEKITGEKGTAAVFLSTSPDEAGDFATGKAKRFDTDFAPQDTDFAEQIAFAFSASENTQIAANHAEFLTTTDLARKKTLNEFLKAKAEQAQAFIDPATGEATARPNIRPVRVDEGKQLRIDMGGVFDLQKEKDALKRAAAEGYDSVRISNYGEKGEIVAILDPTRIKSVLEQPTLAEAEMGLQALFRSAKDAGMTDLQYQKYLVSLQKAADSRDSAKQRRALRGELREITGEVKKLREGLEETARESVSQQPTYAALLGIGREKLDRTKVASIIGEEGIKRLPREIVSPRGIEGIDPDLHAEFHGIEGGDIMLFSFLDQPKFEDAVAAETQRLFDQRYHGVTSRQKQLEQEIEDLHNDGQAAVLAQELNALRAAVKQKRVSVRLMKNAARDHLRDYKLRDIKPSLFLKTERREARKAAQLLRKGDRSGAAKAKFRQLLNFQMAQESYRVRDKAAKQHKYFKKFLKRPKKNAKLPIAYVEAIRGLLGAVDLNRGRTVEDIQREFEIAEGIHLMVDAKLTKEVPNHYLNSTLREWENLHDAVKSVEKQGLDENTLARAEAKETRDETANAVAAQILTMTDKSDQLADTFFERGREGLVNFAMLNLNTDSLVRNIDGFESLGTAYNAIKKPYDDAISRGYMPGQRGYTHRMKVEAQKLLKIYSMWTEKELRQSNKRYQIPGVRRRMTKQAFWSVLLNMGNLENRAALTDSGSGKGQFTDAELDLIVAQATEKDVAFVNAIWEYLDSFWPEVKDSIRRRQNVIGERVEATAVPTPVGVLKGGYYPLHYDSRFGFNYESRMGPVGNIAANIHKALQERRFGHFTTSHTRNGHTLIRKGSGGRTVKLDPFVISQHVNQVVYDLEVGDAVADIFKVLHHKTVREAFRQRGQQLVADKLDLWFDDIVMGEMHFGDVVEKTLRHLRTGFTISKIGFNLGVIAMQPLGLMQSAVQIGKLNLLRGVFDYAMSPRGSFAYARGQSQFMEQREANYNADVHDAQAALRSSVVEHVVGKKVASLASRGAFYGLVKIQGAVDVATWLGAKRQGMELFAKDQPENVVDVSRFSVKAFHGTRDVIETFDPKKSALRAGGDTAAVFFSSSPELASKFALRQHIDEDPAFLPDEVDFIENLTPYFSEKKLKEIATKHERFLDLDSQERLPKNEKAERDQLLDFLIERAREASVFIDPDTMQATKRPNVQPVRIDPGKQLTVNMPGGIFDWEIEGEALQRARSGGYDSVKITGLGEDVYAVFDKDRIINEFDAKRNELGALSLEEIERKAIEHADRMVARSQASGIFGERTPLERGTVNKRIQQTEFVRAFTALISYFMAKTNVAYERVKTTNYRDPLQVLDLAVDLSLLYVWEALLVSWLRGDEPEEDESKVLWVFRETVKSATAGMIGVREFISEAEGFRGGGVPSAVGAEFGKMWTQWGQGEMDTAAVKSTARFAGTVFGIPIGQAIKIGEAEAKRQDYEDIGLMDYVMGPRNRE